MDTTRGKGLQDPGLRHQENRHQLPVLGCCIGRSPVAVATLGDLCWDRHQGGGLLCWTPPGGAPRSRSFATFTRVPALAGASVGRKYPPGETNANTRGGGRKGQSTAGPEAVSFPPPSRRGSWSRPPRGFGALLSNGLGLSSLNAVGAWAGLAGALALALALLGVSQGGSRKVRQDHCGEALKKAANSSPRPFGEALKNSANSSLGVG